MKSVHDIAEEIVAREGGFVNDQADPGGATKYGVTLGTLQRLALDIDHNGRCDVADVEALSRAEAVDIFVRHYFDRPGIAVLPVEVQPALFDMYVNAGANAVKLLQRMLSAKGYPCRDDGVIGAETVKAARAFAATGALNTAYGIARRDYYYSLADARPASRKYATRRDGGKGGWIVRAESFIPSANWLTDAEHRARVAVWNS